SSGEWDVSLKLLKPFRSGKRPASPCMKLIVSRARTAATTRKTGERLMGRYKHIYESWKRDPEGFWAEAAKEIDWFKPATKTLEEKDGLSRWFVGAETNSCWNAVDRHVKAGHGEQVAIIYDSAMLGRVDRKSTRLNSSHVKISYAV